ncbi:MAG TPA: hypothetical protein VMI11_07280 [Actinomycetes bacterium]|nr:hypothetical protein [Actinomycetes bacterium]
MSEGSAGVRVRPGAEGPLVLTGPPTALRGRVRLGNDGEHRATVRGLSVHGERIDIPAPGPLLARLDPGTTKEVEVRLRAGAGTPPGDYPVRLEIGGQELEAILRVQAAPRLTVAPAIVTAAPGITAVEVQVTNMGNVVADLAATARARLLVDADVPGPFLGPGAAGTPTELDAVLRLPAPVSLPPGSAETLAATVEIPAGLDAERRYVASLPVCTATVHVVVVPRTATPVKRAPSGPRRSHA